MIDTVILLDGKNMAYRQSHTHSALATSDGRPSSVLFGCLYGMLSVAKMFPDAPIVWIWDGRGQTWRHRLYDGYKNNRSKEFVKSNYGQEQQELRKQVTLQIPILKKFLSKTGFRQFEVPGLEGDDLIGIVAKEIVERNLAHRVVILSTDKDFFQLISKRVKVLRGRERGGKLLWADPMEKYKVPCELWTKYRALIGDPSDCIPHICKGLGPVTALKFVQAGLDPSRKKYVKQKFKIKVQGKKVQWKSLWDSVHINYQLSKIIVDRTDSRLSKQVRTELDNLLGGLTIKSLFRRKKKLTEEEHRYMTKFLASYEMYFLLSRKQELWQLP